MTKIKKMYKYLEIVEDSTQEVVLRIDVSKQSDRSIEAVEFGMNRNLNHNKFSTFVNEGDIELKIIN